MAAIARALVVAIVVAGLGYAGWQYRVDILARLEALGTPAWIMEPARELAGLAAPEPSRPVVRAEAPAAPPPRVAAQPAATAAPPPDRAPARPPVPVVTELVVAKASPVVTDAVGTVQAIASIQIKSRVDSVIQEVKVGEGDHVTAGQVLFVLDRRSMDAQIQQAEAALARDQAQLTLARANLERTQTLANTNTASRQTLDQAVRAEVAQLEAAVKGDQAQIANLRVLSTYYEIKSPVAGRIGSLPYKAGSTIRSGGDVVLATVNQIDPVQVSYALPQGIVPQLQDAMRAGSVAVEVTIPGEQRAPLTGRVAFVENAMDLASGTLTVKAEVANPDERLWPGQYVQTRTILRIEPQATVVPNAALQIGQQGPYVYVVRDDQTAVIRPVQVERRVDRDAIIRQGVAAGERVVVDGQLRLFPNARVVEAGPKQPDRARPPGSAATPAAAPSTPAARPPGNS